jgi:tetratricopeptide (TPR) repeat protein
MRRLTRALAPAIFLLLAIAIVCPVSARDAWISVRSKNFLLVGNASEREIRQVAIRLEQFRYVYVFSPLLREFKLNSSAPTTVIVFKSDESMRPFKPLYRGKPAGVAGYFQPADDVNYIALSAETSSEDPYRTIFHEYIHLLVHCTIGKAPAWFNEGLAEYYSTFDVDGDRRVLLGKIIPSHLLLLRNRTLLSLADLLAVDQHSPYYNERDKQGIFYAESWALVHYLMLGAEQKRAEQLSRFVKLITGGSPTEKAFNEAFGANYATIERELQSYVSSKQMPEQISTSAQSLSVSSELQTTPISEAESQTYLGDLLLHMQRLDEAETLLQRALSSDGSPAMALASLGMLRLRQKRFAEAITHLRKAVVMAPGDYLVHYEYALSLSRANMDEALVVTDYSSDVVETMRAELRKAIELRPDFIEAYRLLAFVNLVREEHLDESIVLLKHALTLSPGKDECLFVLAQLYMRKQDFASARQAIQPLLRESAEPQLRESAQNLLQAMKRTEEQAALLKTTGAATQAEDAVAAGSPEVSLESALRKLQEGEQHTRGLLKRIDCAQAGVNFFIDAGDRTLRLHANKLERVRFISFTAEVQGTITCGIRNQPNAVVVTYRPDSGGKIDGQIVALEFVPKDFEFKSKQ